MNRWLARFLVVLVIIIAMAGTALWWGRAKIAQPGPAMESASVVIPRGTGTADIASLLQEADVIDHPWLFLTAVHLSGHQALMAGEYNFPAHASIATIMDMMRRGQTVVHKLTIAEGLTVYQVMAQMRQAGGLTGNAAQSPEEGSLLPQTYFYSLGDTRDALLARMTHAMNELIDELWRRRAPDLPFNNKIEALILASVVERETAIPEERPHIAAVFLNRLRLHMKLQSDPTVIFAVSNAEGILDRPLTRDDLAVKSPYNTYQVEGLPAGPICNPGRASLEAVLHPMAVDDLYFVADGSGGHVFSKSLTDHNRNVGNLRRLENGQVVPPAVKKSKSPR
ncbi:endolytic transglycosylase MltG [Telmatospirillum siberiense]|uniref:Endolytic murein transglycosylase n=1 Tax=Telmatospirillum siberiense TaxID=382514 RepID=A0A2N3PQ74_9PROT|nr:endolytic transglycosylase MltG [Telmatospirillum siberiense]PKU22544.1 endolytic transglycosylase MltG [Telmatospirillum siberiense]